MLAILIARAAYKATILRIAILQLTVRKPFVNKKTFYIVNTRRMFSSEKQTLNSECQMRLFLCWFFDPSYMIHY